MVPHAATKLLLPQTPKAQTIRSMLPGDRMDRAQAAALVQVFSVAAATSSGREWDGSWGVSPD
jgi:hypothetical protein